MVSRLTGQLVATDDRTLGIPGSLSSKLKSYKPGGTDRSRKATSVLSRSALRSGIRDGADDSRLPLDEREVL